MHASDSHQLPLQNREEAQRAKDDLNGIMLHDNELRIGWGKAISIPSAPMFVLNPPGGLVPVRGATIAPPGALASLMGPRGGAGVHDPIVPSGQLCILHLHCFWACIMAMQLT